MSQVINGYCGTTRQDSSAPTSVFKETDQTHGHTTITGLLREPWVPEGALTQEIKKGILERMMPVLSHKVWRLGKSRIPSKSNRHQF